MKKSTVFANLLFTAAFFAFLIFMGVESYHLPKETVSSYENRTLAQIPAVTPASLGDGSYFTKLETAFCDHSAYRTDFLRLGTALDLALGRPVVNTVFPAKDGVYLPYHEYSVVDQEAIAQKAQKMAQDLALLQAQIEAYGGRFLYVAVPDQSVYYSDYYPSYLNDSTQQVQAIKNAFLTAAEEKGIEVLDMDARWAAEGNPAHYMSGEDHHFTFEGGYATYQAILETLGMEKTVEFTVQEWQAPLIGSRIVRLCDLMAPRERLRYATPTEWIPFTRYNWSNDTPAYENTIALPAEGQPIRYGNYMGGDVTETIIQTNRPELTDCLVFGDSFTNLIETMIYTEFDEMRSLDYRYYEGKPISQYIAEYQPEVVILVRDTANLLNSDGNGKIQ